MEYLELAKEQISKKMYLQALNLLTEFDKKYPGNVDTSFYFGKCNFYLEQYQIAGDFFKKVLGSDVSSKENKKYSEYYLAMIYNRQKKYTDMIDVLLSLELDEKHEKHIGLLGIINDLISSIKDKSLQLSADIQNDKMLKIIDKFCADSAVSKSVLENAGDFILNIMQTYNYCGEYGKTINLYQKYHDKYLKNIFLSNKFLNEYELAQHKVILESKPRNIMLVLTNTCDLNCIMCYQNKNPARNIDKKLVDIVLDNLQYLEKIIWQGGEVLILPYFKNILLKTLQFPAIQQIITSNFQNVSDDIIELIPKNNINLTISIDGAVKQTYEKIRLGASFDKLEKNLKKLNHYMNVSVSKMSLQINFLVMRMNYKEIPDIVDFANKYKFSIIVFLRCVTDDLNFKITKELEKDVELFISQATEKAEKYNIKIINVFSQFNDSVSNDKENIPEKEISCHGLFCHLPWYEMVIHEDNAVKPHCTCEYSGVSDTGKFNNIYDIWNSQTMQKYREGILKADNGKCIDICRLMSLDARKKITDK